MSVKTELTQRFTQLVLRTFLIKNAMNCFCIRELIIEVIYIICTFFSCATFSILSIRLSFYTIVSLISYNKYISFFAKE